QTTAIRASSRPYSASVAPSSWRVMNLRTNFLVPIRNFFMDLVLSLEKKSGKILGAGVTVTDSTLVIQSEFASLWKKLLMELARTLTSAMTSPAIRISAAAYSAKAAPSSSSQKKRMRILENTLTLPSLREPGRRGLALACLLRLFCRLDIGLL